MHQVPLALIDDANVATKHFINTFQNRTDGALTRPGEVEPEMFLVSRSGGKTDLKKIFHFSHDLLDTDFVHRWRADMSQADSYHFNMMAKLHNRLNDFAICFIRELEASYPDLFAPSVVANVRASMEEVLPYSTTTTRGLWYPSHSGQRGAKGHLDRSLLTLHCGDSGGELRGHPIWNGDSAFPTSPEKGDILIFAGVKMLYATRGRILPLWHSATTAKDEDRHALVHFVHTDVGVRVVDAEETYEQYCHAHRHDPVAFYNDWWEATKMGGRD
ncbi:MAG: hypothetical protein AAB388_00280 [Patescibacteria group bacterium]